MTDSLNSALETLGELMADNLESQGVTASANDGLTTLANKILDIQTGGGSCYHIEFTDDSYTTTGGNATVSIFLQSNYEPLSNATVTFTSSASTTTTATTDSNGIATATISFSENTTLTATYSNVTATATITVPTPLFYDDCSSNSRLSEYGSSVSLTGSRSSTLSYNSTENAYYLNRSTNGDSFTGFKLPLTQTNNIKITLKVKLSSTSAYCQLGIWEKQSSSVYEFIRIRGDKVLDGFKNNTNSNVFNKGNVATFNTAYYYLEISYQDGNRTVTVYDGNKTQLQTWTGTFQSYTNGEMYIAHNNNNTGAYIKEIKVESL